MSADERDPEQMRVPPPPCICRFPYIGFRKSTKASTVPAERGLDLRIHEHPADLLRNLIRFDTTNPPGAEAPCIAYVESLLKAFGFETTLVGKDPNRPNLITRLCGIGNAPPLLLFGHVDVVPTADQDWSHDPFDAVIERGYIWGRGALDMKSGVAMMLSALLRLRAERATPAGDIVLAVLSDEEAGGDWGARYLATDHAALFEGVRYAISEFGGFSFHVSGRKFYPIQVTEKQKCWVRATVRGPGGHGSLPVYGGAMGKLGRVLERLDARQMPVHVTSTARQMFLAMARALPFPKRQLLRQLLRPAFTDRILRLLGESRRVFDPLLRNTVTPTVVHGGKGVNVVPSQIDLELDVRLLPGYGPDDLLRELRGLLGDSAELDVLRYDPGPPEPDMGLFDTLAGILREADPEGVPIPMLLPGVTDARHFARLGIQTYGFMPMNLPAGFNFIRTIHAADERIPVECVDFGTRAIYELLRRYGRNAG